MQHPEKIELLGQNIQDLRKKKGWSQQKLADEANIERRVLQRIEYGEGGPTVDTLISICLALESGIEVIFEGILPVSD